MKSKSKTSKFSYKNANYSTYTLPIHFGDKRINKDLFSLLIITLSLNLIQAFLFTEKWTKNLSFASLENHEYCILYYG